MSKKTEKVQEEKKDEAREDISSVSVSNYAQQAYLDYAMSVVCGRAIPYLEDGQKPVQRRTLYTMNEMRLAPEGKPVKSAKIIGTVLGSYHPHGDQSVYDAMVRQTQDFVMRYPLVHGEGNFGSRDGDGAAAMRYTEAKLSNNSKHLLRDLGSGTVDYRPNYDGTTEEPDILPARLPFILMNGAEGVGVGMACSIPPHRAQEIAGAAITLLKNPEASFEEVMAHIPGPDFPTGGQLIQSREKILSAYKEGNGTLKLRGSWIVETGARGAWKLIIKELPYGVSAQRLMEQVDGLLNPKPKEKGNKKEFTQDQLRIKQLFSGLIDVYRDESGKEQAIRVVFEPKSMKQDPEDLVQALLAYTSLQDVVRLNFVVVGRDRRPAQKGVVQLLKEWSEFRVEITRRRLNYEKMVAEKRLHIVQGRIKVIDAIREAIDLIQSSDDPKKALMERFDLTEVQAIDVLDMRLRQLAKMEGQALEKERAELEKTIARLNRVLAKMSELVQLVIQEIEEDIKALGDDPRRTVVQEIAEIDGVSSKSKPMVKMAEEPLTIAVSDKFWVRARSGYDQAAETFAFKTGDAVAHLLNATTHDTLAILDHTGRIYNVDASELPNTRGGEGMPLSAQFEAQGKFLHPFVVKANQSYMMYSDLGHGFIAKSTDFMTRMKAGKVMLVPAEGGIPMSPCLLRPEDKRVFCLSSDGSLVGFALSELPELSKGKGVALMGLREGCKVISMIVLNETEQLQIIEKGKAKTLKEEEVAACFGPRSAGKKGKKVAQTAEAKLGKV